MSASRTIVFFPEGAFGPTNNCVGIGQVLRERGHRVVFVVEESFKGTLEARGFEEALMRLGPPPDADEAPGQFWKDFIRDTAPEFRKPTIEQLDTWIKPVWEELINGARHCEPQLKKIIERVRPDVIVEERSAVGPHPLVQPPRAARPRDPSRVLRVSDGGPIGVGRVPNRVRPYPPADVGGVRRVRA